MAAKSATHEREIKGTVSPGLDLLIDTDLRHRVEELAYLKAEARGFIDGHELDDWIEAERELLQHDGDS